MRQFDYYKCHQEIVSSEVLPLLCRLHEQEGELRGLIRSQPRLFDGFIESTRLHNAVTFSRLSGLNVPETAISAHALDKKKPANGDELLVFVYCDIVTDIAVIGAAQHAAGGTDTNGRNDWLTHGDLNALDIPTVAVKEGVQINADDLEIPFSAFSVMNCVRSVFSGREGDKENDKDRYREKENQIMVDNMLAGFNKVVTMKSVDPIIPVLCLEMDYSFIQCQRRGFPKNNLLLLLFLLNRAGFGIGHFISLEEILKERREEAEIAFRKSTKAWMSGDADYTPYVAFFLETLISAYRMLFASLPASDGKRLPHIESVLNFITESQTDVNKKTIMSALPWISQKSVERALSQLQKQDRIVMKSKGRASTYEVKCVSPNTHSHDLNVASKPNEPDDQSNVAGGPTNSNRQEE